MKFIFLIIIFLASCVQPVSNLSEGDEFSNTNLTDSPVEVITSISWIENQIINKILYRSSATNKISYLTGDDVYNYLRIEANYNSTYCMIINFTTSTSSNLKELRVKLNPNFTINYQTNKKDYYLRAATSNATGNDFCNKPIETISQTGVITLTPPTNPIAYYAGEVCTGCSNDINSQSINFYKYNNINNSLVKISNTDLKSNDLKFIIQPSQTSNDNGANNTCSDASCNQQGFNCCVANQCVNNKAPIKLTSEMSAAELLAFNLAEAEKESNPNWYLQYPNIYYVCPNFVEDQDNGNGNDTTNPQTELELKIQDYNCINELQTYSEITPFHESPINSAHTYSFCNISDTNNSAYFETVMLRMYDRCGCDSSNISLAQKVAACPKYIYNPIYEQDVFGNDTTTIINLSCGILNPQTGDDGSIKIIEVSSKSAPHRYFNTDNFEIDLDKNPNLVTNQTQEGSPFVYLDSDYIFPQNGSFNMNSILGQMYVNLDSTKPAKKIKVDFDKQYYLATLSGYYTPCPTCAKDSWYGQFSAHPSSGQGYGLQSLGFTTNRSALGTNNTFGNYEDTHFGRACYVPPTMIPFSQRAYADNQTQRLNRLKTQASLFINGYQKDWYGFNKGAMIGSFDGVTWFPIGNGRIVRSTSEYLYLAINAPFADLAQQNNHVISVQQWDGFTTGTRYDFDPTVSLNNTFQNQGGTCQENYLCEADKDCITKLGWEYTCQDVTTVKTTWPKFNTATSNEVSNESKTGSLFQFLQQAQMPPGNNNKRCVYRGSGSICRTNIEEITTESLRRQLSCAPNFYCANINTAGVFNKEIARFGAPLQNLIEGNNHFYGMDANQLGRPKHYITNGNGSSLPNEVRTAIAENLLLMDPSSTNKAGLCLPGRALPKINSGTLVDYIPSDNHDKADTQKRADFINQIGGCNAALFEEIKYASCPLLDSEGNYTTLKDSFNSLSAIDKYNTLRYSSTQNACGLESLDSSVVLNATSSASSLSSFNAFASIESLELNTATIVSPTLVANACLRRAGSVCHTNLDCSPNSRHADLVDIITPDFFGNEAERKYWSEDLICAQGNREPSQGESLFNSYDITNNLCCREIGKSISIHTQDSDSNINIDVRKFASIEPNASDRYSRFSILGALVNSYVPGINDGQYVAPSASKNLTDPTNILTPYQWRTIDETASKTCCGGGWIRKFADGTNNWTINRLNLDINNFACLNSKSPLSTITDDEASRIDNNINYINDLELDKSKYCSDPVNGYCSDRNFSSLDFSIDTKPSLNNTTTYQTAKTIGTSDSFSFFPPMSADSNPLTFLNWNLNYATDNGQIRRNIRIKIPSYIPINMVNPNSDFVRTTNEAQTISEVRLLGEDGTNKACYPKDWRSDFYGMTSFDAAPWWNDVVLVWNDADPPELEDLSECMYTIDRINREMYIAFRATLTIPNTAYSQINDIFHAEISYLAPGTQAWEDYKIPSLDPLLAGDNLTHRRSSTPGEPIYYLDKLANLELIGIPQITYEPLYCNNNYQKLVPGIFDESYKSILDVRNEALFSATKEFFESSTHSKPFTNMTAAEETELNRPFVATKEALAHTDIFSSDDMKCCIPLGRETENGNNCCSGFAQTSEDDQKKYCKIPKGVNLNVYFNKFVSNEGSHEGSGSAVLTEADFDSKTGAPKLSSTVLQKVTQLGVDFCENATTRRGSAFGNYRPQPSSGSTGDTTFYNIVDSYSDAGQNNATLQGASIFGAGYRWNHNIYCD